MKMSFVMFLSKATSQLTFFKSFLIAGCLLMLFGCREYKLYHYEEIKDKILGGELVVEVVASRSLSEVDNKKIAVEGNPYSLLFKFFSGEQFSRIEVDELVLVGVDSGNKIDLPLSASLESRLFPDTDRYFAIATFSKQLKGVELKYEAYDLKAVLYLHSLDGEKQKTYINYRLKTKYKTDSRSDIVDGMMGI